MKEIVGAEMTGYISVKTGEEPLIEHPDYSEEKKVIQDMIDECERNSLFNRTKENEMKTETNDKQSVSDKVNALISLPDCLIAKAMCEACGEDVHQKGDARENDWRWEDYLEFADEFKKNLKFYADEGPE